MTKIIEVGTLLLKEGTPLPNSVPVESNRYFEGWRLVKNLSGSILDKKLSNVGWTFFFMAGELTATALGSDSEKTTLRAIKGVIAKMKPGKFNCLEISRVAAKSFLGLSYVTVAGHARHIQESLYLFHAKYIAEWDPPKLAAASTEV